MAALIAAKIAFLVHPRHTGISSEQAERIALRQAEMDGYEDAKLWTRFHTEITMRYFYSESDRKDVHVWSVYVDAAGNPPIKNTPAVIYYIKRNNGAVINTINGMKAGSPSKPLT